MTCTNRLAEPSRDGQQRAQARQRGKPKYLFFFPQPSISSTFLSQIFSFIFIVFARAEKPLTEHTVCACLEEHKLQLSCCCAIFWHCHATLQNDYCLSVYEGHRVCPQSMYGLLLASWSSATHRDTRFVMRLQLDAVGQCQTSNCLHINLLLCSNLL